MVSWPQPGTRVSVRYRRAPGSVPPLTDAVGHLLAVDPRLRVRTKTGAVVEIAPADVVALRELTDAPVRAREIRSLEHAAAAARPAADQAWLDGWLLRAAPEAGLATNSALPLDLSANTGAIPGIADWYQRRGLAPRLALPDRLLALSIRLPAERTERILVHDLPSVTPARRPDPSVTPEQRSGQAWRAVVTDSPDGTRWVGLWPVSGTGDRASATSCEELLAWGAGRGATRGYVELGDDDTELIAVAEALGFRLHHRRRYVAAPPMDTV